VSDLVIADSDRRRASGLASELGCRSTDVESLWREDLAGVVIASPSPTHASMVETALDAGVSVLCEKPLTTTLARSAAISERSAETGVPGLVGFQRRFDASFRGLREEFARGDFGQAWVLRLRHSDTGVPPGDYLADSGGLFVDMCIHDFDAVRWVTGCEVEAVSSAGMRLGDDAAIAACGDVDAAVSLLHLDNGSLAIVEAFRRSPHGYQAEAEVTTEAVTGGTSPSPGRSGDWIERFASAFAAQLKGFVATLDGGAMEGATAADATADLRIALAARRASREGRAVRVDAVG
jgi:myo-inositol 2-dehydrogenase/D-chiro-inositol 1-dehydrogenase